MKMERKIDKKIFHNILLYGVMFFYLLILFGVLFLKKNIGSFQSVNLIPFHTIGAYMFSDDIILKSFALSNVLGNIVIFVPLGIYATLLNKKKSIIVNTSVVALLSAGVEVLQFVFKVGASDIDDVILNTIGGLVGIILFQVIHVIFKSKTKLAIELLAPIGGVLAFLILIIINR